MRVVVDTNGVVSGMFWRGAPREILEAARAGRLTLFTSAALLAELQDVLARPKFAARLALAGIRAADLILGYAALAALTQPAEIDPVIFSDPDDDAVLACAVAAGAEAIISGDHHLLMLGQYEGITILSAAEFLKRLAHEPT